MWSLTEETDGWAFEEFQLTGGWHFSGIAVEIRAVKELAKLLLQSFRQRKENWKIVLREFLITYPVPQGIGPPHWDRSRKLG